MQTQSACTSCRGQGEQINEKDKCKVCNGSKVVKKDCKLTVSKVALSGIKWYIGDTKWQEIL